MQGVHQQVIPIHMIRPNLDAIPHFDLPPGITACTFRPGGKATWAAIHPLPPLRRS